MHRSLFTVFIIDPNADKVIYQANIIATSAQAAERKAIQMAGGVITGDIENYDFVTELRGTERSIRPKSKE